MKKILIILACFAVFACERQDTINQAANLAYRLCVEDGGSNRFCRCVGADLKETFSENVAKDFISGKYFSATNNFNNQDYYKRRFAVVTATNAARLRCECRINPQKFAYYNLPCDGVKPLKF